MRSLITAAVVSFVLLRDAPADLLLPQFRSALSELPDGEAAWRQVAMGIVTDAEGRFTFTVYEGLSYLARAHYNLPDDPTHRQAQGMTGPFVVSAATAPLTVVITLPPPRR